MQNMFSIYLINKEYIWKDLLKHEKNPEEKKDLIEICEKILKIIKYRVDNDGAKSFLANKDTSFLFMFKKVNQPQWLQALSNKFLIENNDEDFEWVNQSVSFLKLTIVGKNIYGTTGGYASAYIKPYIIRNFGLNILTKIFDESDPIIQEVTENLMQGSRQSVTAGNRFNTNIKGEKDYAKIFKIINAVASTDLGIKLGVLDEKVDKKELKDFNIISSDSLNIRKSMSLKDYKRVLNKIDTIDQETSKFALGYYVPIQDEGLKRSEVIDAFYQILLKDESAVDEVLLTGESFSKYLNADRWVLSTETEKNILPDDKPLTFSNIYSYFVGLSEKELSKTRLISLMSTHYITYYSNGEVIEHNKKIFDMVDYFFNSEIITQTEIEGESVKIPKNLDIYLNAGSAYLINTTYKKFIKDAFKEFYKNGLKDMKGLFEKNGLNRIHGTETAYNDSFKVPNESANNVIHADKVLFNNVEICDLLLLQNNTAYFICNKMSPTGMGVRDLNNQIDAASAIVLNDEDWAKNYFEKLAKKSEYLNNIGFKYFKKYLNNIVFIASFTKEPLTPDSQSTYAKLLNIQLEKALKERNHRLYLTSPRNYVQ